MKNLATKQWFDDNRFMYCEVYAPAFCFMGSEHLAQTRQFSKEEAAMMFVQELNNAGMVAFVLFMDDASAPWTLRICAIAQEAVNEYRYMRKDYEFKNLRWIRSSLPTLSAVPIVTSTMRGT